MPTYEYKCDACGAAFEKFQSMSSAPIKKCPTCGKSKVRRLIGTGAGLIFKGSGFYITDYRSDSYKNAAKTEGGSKPETPAKADTAAPATSSSSPSTEPASTPAPKAEPKTASKSAKKSSSR